MPPSPESDQLETVTKRVVFNIGFIAALCYFGFWWLYKLNVLPGLHGDEAWFGLQAAKYAKEGVTSFHGMNNYTGILESLMASVLFKWGGINVTALRLGGVLTNIIALLILSKVFVAHGHKKALVIFMLILAQSGLYLISPRIAWEVNSLTLLFIAINAFAITGVLKANNRPPFLWGVIFLATNMVGTYNHIIFSGFSIALLSGVLLWRLHFRTNKYRSLLILLFLNAFNVCLLYVFSNFYPLNLPVPYVVVGFLFLTLLEMVVANQFSNCLKVLDNVVLPKPLTYLILLTAIIYFAIHHGLAFIDVWSNYKLFMHAYSIEFPVYLQWLCITIGITMLLLICWFIIADLKSAVQNSLSSAFVFVLISYTGILPFYTTNNSFRYYLIIYVLTAMYLTIKIANSKSLIKFALPVILVSLIVVNITMGYVYFFPDRELKALKIPVGNGTIETSAHFLPSEPLIKYLSDNKIGRFYYLSDPYFLGQVVDFYRLANPWEELPGNEAVIDYDYSPNPHGGYMFYKK